MYAMLVAVAQVTPAVQVTRQSHPAAINRSMKEQETANDPQTPNYDFADYSLNGGRFARATL
jgi:hypothetical protein